jgi:hypothetical protein
MFFFFSKNGPLVVTGPRMGGREINVQDLLLSIRELWGGGDTQAKRISVKLMPCARRGLEPGEPRLELVRVDASPNLGSGLPRGGPGALHGSSPAILPRSTWKAEAMEEELGQREGPDPAIPHRLNPYRFPRIL